MVRAIFGHGLILVALSGLTILALPRPAEACRCRGPGAGPAALRRADVAFHGVVVSVAHDLPRAPHQVTRATFEVRQVFKGDPPRRVEVDLGDTSCGLRRAAVGEQWVVFARRDDEGHLHTRQCTGTRRLARAGAELSARAQRTLARLAALASSPGPSGSHAGSR